MRVLTIFDKEKNIISLKKQLGTKEDKHNGDKKRPFLSFFNSFNPIELKDEFIMKLTISVTL